MKVHKIYRTAKTYGDVQKWRQPFLTSALGGGGWLGPLQNLGKSPWYRSNRRLVGTLNTSERCEEANLLTQPGIQPTFLSCPARNLVTILPELHHFL
jgi:hypothetical protein